MGVFDQLADAMSGKATPQQSPTTSGPSSTQTTKITAGDLAAAAQRRAERLRAAAQPNGVSGVDTAMSAHADKMHPVK